MRAINLYFLSREVPENTLSSYEKALSDRKEPLSIRNSEIELIRTLVNNMKFFKLDDYCYDGWFYSFSIPQISKEFDLLKISTDKRVINLELKGGEVPLDRIKKQLVQNRHYLSAISKDITSFTCLKTDDDIIKVFKLEDGELRDSSMECLMYSIKQVKECVNDNIEGMLRPRDYLVSPLNSPDEFMNGEYFLSNQQEEIKKRILGGLCANHLWGITGSPGTGKTLLLYDIAITLSENYKVVIIHSGNLCEGHRRLDSKLLNVSVMPAKDVKPESIAHYEYVFVDETQRLYGNDLRVILEALHNNEIKGCVFAYDQYQVLSHSEEKRNNADVLRKQEGFREECLSDRIRTNKDIATFIHNLMHLNFKAPPNVSYDDVDILYANNVNESDRIIEFFKEKDYFPITITPSLYKINGIDHYASYENSHDVIGQEFDNVLVVMDDNFRYDEKGELEGIIHPNPDYIFSKLFYQNITRAREKLCIVVLGNEAVFEKLIEIKNNTYNTIAKDSNINP